MYGYHPRQHTFVKIYFYNPFMVKRAAELLQGDMNEILEIYLSELLDIGSFFCSDILQKIPCL